MQLMSRFRVKNINNVIEFLNDIHVGRLAIIDVNGYPQIIPMNFVHTVTDLSRKNFSPDYGKPTYREDTKVKIQTMISREQTISLPKTQFFMNM